MGKRKVYLRADADDSIGFGHFMRTLALAEVLSPNYDCTFVTQTPSTFQKQCLKGVCKLIETPSNDSKFQIFVDMIKEGVIVVLDNYFFNVDYEKQLRQKGAAVVLIDNLHERHSFADAVIGFSLGLKKEDYSVETYTKLYLGPSYSLLRKPFIDQLTKKHAPICDDKSIKVVVSFGGADRKGIAISIAKILEQSSFVSEVTVIGNTLEELPNSNKIKVKSNLMADGMRDAFVSNDVAVLPASTTALEAIACGIPVIGGYFVDNQISNYNHYVESNVVLGCGDFRDKSNQMKVKSVIESGIIGKDFHVRSIIPVDLEQKLFSIFEAL